MTTTAAPQRLRVCETLTRQPGPLRVDREKGVIEGVKILGPESANRRRYTSEAMRRAVIEGLYDDAKVFIDHPDPSKPDQPRPADKVFAKIRNAKVTTDGVYGDLHYNREHPLAKQVCEDCERGLGLFGLSHNAEAGQWEVKDGVQIITEIAAVHSVDLVSDPATNSNLWEGRTIAGTATVETPTPAKKIKLSDLIEGLSINPKLPKALRKRLLEMDDMPPTELDTPAASAETEPMQLLAQAAAALAASGDAAQHEMGMKILKLLKPETATEADDEEDDEDEKKPKEGKGKRARKPAPPAPVGLTESRAKALIKLAGVPETPELLEAVTGTDEDRALRVIELARGRPQVPELGFNGARTGPSTPIAEGKGGNGQGNGKLKFEGEKAQESRLAYLRGAN